MATLDSLPQSSSPEAGHPNHKDFQDHLRKVHFALVVASGILFVATLGDGNRHVLIAYEDAKVISAKAGQLPDSFPISRIIQNKALGHAPRTLYGLIRAPAERDTIAFRLRLASRPVWARYDLLQLRSRPLFRIIGFTDSVPLPPRIVNEVIATEPRDIDRRIRTLRDWRILWNSVDSIPTCVVGDSVHRGDLWFPSDSSAERVELHRTEPPDFRSPRRKWLYDLQARYVLGKQRGQLNFTIQIEGTGQRTPAPAVGNETGAQLQPLGDSAAVLLPRGDTIRIVLHCNSQLSLQRELSTFFGKDWQPGPYSTTYPDLSALAYGLDDADIDNVSEMLKQEIGGGSQQIEVGGFALPVSILSLGGLGLLLVLQVNYFLHLRAFRRLSPAERVPWSFAFLGMYDDRFSRTVYAISASVLPCLAALALLGNIATRGYSPQGLPLSGLLFLGVLLMSGLIFLTAPLHLDPHDQLNR
jgi:hypothetical protein